MDPIGPQGATRRPPRGPVRMGQLGQASLRPHWAHLLAEASGAREGTDPEHVHRMRVATRRLRAGLRLFEDGLPGELVAQQAELRWLAGALGAVRDIDVQLEELFEAAREVQAEPALVEALAERLRNRVARARLALVAALDSPRFATLQATMGRLLEARVRRPGRPVARQLPTLVRRRYQRLQSAGRGLDADSPDDDLHAARIRAKQLRYVLELAAPVYGQRARRLARRAVALQDALGIVQDAAVASELFQALRREAGLPAEINPVIDALIGWHARRAEAARQAFPAAFRRLRGRPWQRLARRMRQLRD